MQCPGSADPNQAEYCLDQVCTGTYVAVTGDDANPGTRALPKRTIAGGLVVAVRFWGQGAVPKPVVVRIGNGTYAEDLEQPAATNLQGSWDAAWTRNAAAHATILNPSDVRGVRYSAAAPPSSGMKLSGFTIHGATSSGDTAAISITNGATPELADVEVVAGNTTGSANSVAISISGPGSRASITRSALTGGTSSLGSYGVLARDRAGLDLSSSSARAGAAGTTSVGVDCQGRCAASSFVDVTIEGGTAPTSRGLVVVSGDAVALGAPAAVTITRAALRGAAVDGAGLVLGPCNNPAIQVTHSTIVGARGNGASTGVGVLVGPSCTVEIDDSQLFGVDTGHANVAEGIVCKNGSACILQRDAVWGAGPAGGVAQVTFGADFENYGEATSSVIRGGHCNPLGYSNATGVRISDAQALVENNVIIAGEGCSATWGVRESALPSHPPSALGPTTIQHNHIDGRSKSGFGASYGIYYGESGAASSPPAPRGSLRNNTIIAGGAMTGANVWEDDANGEPVELRNNNLFSPSGLPLYRNDGVLLTSLAEVNAMTSAPAASGNISADPLVTDDWHLTAASPNRGAGLAPGSGYDFDGQSRPQPAGTNPDIGPDERD